MEWQRRGWVLGVLLGLLGGWQISQAAEFTCPAGASGVACLIEAMNTANTNGEENTITLAAGTYTLTAIDNNTEGPNGLPSITSTLVITGAGATATSIARASTLGTPELRLLHVAATGSLVLNGVTLQGGLLGPFGSGGGIGNYGTLTLTNSILAHNTANSGGGIFNSGTVTLSDSTLAYNTATAIFGGGGIENNGNLTVTNSTLAYNTTSGNGGGINNFTGNLTVTNSTLVHNAASGGGGIDNSIFTVTLTNSTLAYNTAQRRGGGIGNYGILTLTNSTLAHNTANSGGGIYSPPSSTTLQNTMLQNTILALNTTPEASPQANDCVGGVTSLGTNLIGDPTECPITLQSNDLTGDPGLDAFTTGDGVPGHGHFPLLQTSQAINAGNDDICPATDQLGHSRVGQCEIGAIEFQPSDTTPPAITIVSVTPDILWPPNGKLVPVIVVATITDGEGSGVDSDTVTYEVIDEYGSVQPSDDILLGDDGRYTAIIPLQASRHEDDANGRLYTITVYAQDLAGNEGSATTSVRVPHDRGQGRSIAAR